jgi:hypothetical protein
VTQAFPVPSQCRDCPEANTVAVHTAEIADLKQSTVRVESKLDKLLWWIMATCATAAGALVLLLLTAAGGLLMFLLAKK